MMTVKGEGNNSGTGEIFQTQECNIDKDFIDWVSVLSMTEAKVKKTIDNLDVSADTKALLYSFSKATIKAGEFVIKVGRKIVDFICELFTRFPSTSFGIIFGAVAGFLIASIPVLGLLSSVVTPILIAFGMTLGMKEDIKDKALARKIAEINAKFSPLKA